MNQLPGNENGDPLAKPEDHRSVTTASGTQDPGLVKYARGTISPKLYGLFSLPSAQQPKLFLSGTILQVTLDGKEEEVQDFLNTAPQLMLESGAMFGTATDRSGKQVRNLTPFQVALNAGDMKMLNMMVAASKKMKGGQEGMQQQFEQIFPGERGLETHFEMQCKDVYNFTPIVDAIHAAKDKPTELQNALSTVNATLTKTDEAKGKEDSKPPLIEALNRFREEFRQKSHNETVFNPQHLLKALAVYKSEDWNPDQKNLFQHQVIGFVQEFLPACDARAFTVYPDGNCSNYEDYIQRKQNALKTIAEQVRPTNSLRNSIT